MNESIQETSSEPSEKSLKEIQQEALAARGKAMEAADRTRANLGETTTYAADQSGNLLSPTDQDERRELGHNALK